MADALIDGGADLEAAAFYADENGVDVASGVNTRRELLVTWLREQGARPAGAPP